MFTMPAAVIPAHAAIRDELKESVTRALDLSGRLRQLIADKPRYPSGRFHGKIDHAPPPWYTLVANSFMDLHAFSRKLERDFRGELNFPDRVRGGSDVNTRKALESVCRLAESTDDFMVKLGTRELKKWSRRALIILTEIGAAEDYEETEIPKRLPRQPGETERPCIWCKNKTLRLFPLKGEVRCVDPDCHDEEGRRPRAALEYSHMGEIVLLWQDNISGLPAAA